MKNVGIIGWRGMVGSVLLERMTQEKDFEHIHSHFFSTSQAGQKAPTFTNSAKTLLDAHDLEQLSAMDIIISCQGGDYTKKVHPALRDLGWKGFWIDAASALRMKDTSIMVLDPVNKIQIIDGISRGTKDFIGSNCTV
jgi:aspartate-semialdehyde dehydrogenase